MANFVHPVFLHWQNDARNKCVLQKNWNNVSEQFLKLCDGLNMSYVSFWPLSFADWVSPNSEQTNGPLPGHWMPRMWIHCGKLFGTIFAYDSDQHSLRPLGAVIVYTKRLVLHCWTKTELLWLLCRDPTCPPQHQGTDRASTHEVEYLFCMFSLLWIFCILKNLRSGLTSGLRFQNILYFTYFQKKFI